MYNQLAAEAAEPPPVLIFVCDADFSTHAKDLAGKLGAPVRMINELTTKDLIHVDHVVVDADLRDTSSIGLLKHALDRVPEIRERTYLVDGGSSERVLKVQANALGATRHMLRRQALAELQREYSLVGGFARSQAVRERELAAPGGVSIAKAEESLTLLFEGLLADRPVSLKGVSLAAASVLASVGEVGAAQWLATVREHHEGTFQHCLLVTGVAAGLASGAKLSTPQAGALMNAAILHDIGKAVIPRHILDKPGRLTPDEFEAVKRHPQAGYDYLMKNSSVPPAIMEAVLHHHEALDGSGYPHGLKGDSIPPLTRILTVCDVFAALVEARAYKAAKTPEQAVEVLIDMTLSSKVDYSPVRALAGSFGIDLPPTVGELVKQVAGVPTFG